MAARHVVVDGSNLATEGRSMPSLAQLDRAVREFLLENPEDVVTVVVDASFGHRIDTIEFKMFEEAEAAGELVSPPAGAIGRGDAFLLRIADKTGATVLSNDSFQEFHGDYDWLFERGRLIGGKPVPGVGWIFTPRTPVRGPRSREAVKEAKRKTKAEPVSAMPGLDLAAARSRTQGKGKKNVERAIAVALEEVVAPKDKPRRRRKGGEPPADPVNDPLSFITFIAAHPLGGEVVATVESFASHGAFVDSDGARCYVPLSAMGEPPPKSAREMFTKGEQVRFVVQALDPQRRGVELALPGFAKIAGAPTEETVAAEIEGRADEEAPAVADGVPAPARRTRKKAAPAQSAAGPDGEAEPANGVSPAPAMKAPSRRRGAQARSEATLEATATPEMTAPEAVPTKLPAKRAAARRKASPAKATAAPEAAGPEAAAPEAAAPEAAAPEAAAPEAAVAKKATARRRAAALKPASVAAAVPEGSAPDAVMPLMAVPDVAVPPKKAASRRRGPAVLSAPAPGPSPVKKAASRRRGPGPEPAGPAQAPPVASSPVAPGRQAEPPKDGAGAPTGAPRRRAPKVSAIPVPAEPAVSPPVGETAPPDSRRRRGQPRTESTAPSSQAQPAKEPRLAKRSPAKKASPQVPTPSSP